MSIIRSSISRRRDNPRTIPTTRPPLDPTQHFDEGHKYWSSPGSSSSSSSRSGSRISQKLNRLHRLQIPITPLLPSIKRHPSVLRAGPRTQPERRITPATSEVSTTQELFIPAQSPHTLDLAPRLNGTTPQRQYLPPFAFNHRPASISRPCHPYTTINKPTELPLQSTDLNPLKRAINALYNATSILIPPYLLEHLNQLKLIEDNLDFEFLRYKHEKEIQMSINTAIEMVERVQQFLPVLRRMADLVSEMLVRERRDSKL